MQDNLPRQENPQSGSDRDGIGCWYVGLIPAWFLAYSWTDAYMQGYNSWRDSLWCLPIYVIMSFVAALAMSMLALPHVRARSVVRPLSVFIIARLYTVSGLIFLPIAVSLGNNTNTGWEQESPKILYFLPLVSVALSMISGITLMKMYRWSRIGAVLSTPVILICGGLVAWDWFRMTYTTPDDWLLIPFASSNHGFLMIYSLIAIPASMATVWCLTRKDVIEAFGKKCIRHARTPPHLFD